MCDVLDATALKPQNLVQNANSKTHLTNHCSGIRRGRNLSEVVNATRNKYKSTFTYFNISTRYINIAINHALYRIEKERMMYIVNDLFYESSTIYQDV